MIPPGCTSLIQPLNVFVNAPFKAKIEAYAEQHYEANWNKHPVSFGLSIVAPYSVTMMAPLR